MRGLKTIACMFEHAFAVSWFVNSINRESYKSCAWLNLTNYV